MHDRFHFLELNNILMLAPQTLPTYRTPFDTIASIPRPAASHGEFIIIIIIIGIIVRNNFLIDS